jgi:predicted RecB family nuclease
MTCPEFLHKKYAPNRFELGELSEPSGMAQEISKLGLKHETRVLDQLKVTTKNFVQIDSNLPRKEREDQTFASLINSEIDIILGAIISGDVDSRVREHLKLPPITVETRVSSPDVLVRASGNEINLPQWIPIDVKSHSAFDENTSNYIWQNSVSAGLNTHGNKVPGRLKQADALQLAHYVTHLSEIGIGYEVPIAGIIGRDGDFVTWADLQESTYGSGASKENAMQMYARKFKEALEVVEQSTLRNSDDSVQPPAIPMYDSSAKMCPTCRYKNECLTEMAAYKGSGHVTLLSGVTPSKAALLEVDSIGDLARSVSAPKDLMQKAKVYGSGIPEVANDQVFEVPTFDVEIDIDLENSQGSLQEIGEADSAEPDRVFLYGYIRHDRTLVHDWNSNDPESFENYGGDLESEFDVLSRMWDYLVSEVNSAKADGKTIGIFHYSPVEVTWFRRFAERYEGRDNVPTPQEVQDFVEQNFYDLIKTAKQVVFPPSSKSPICGYSIKTLAPLIPFEWHVNDAGGAEALVKYKQAFEQGSQSAQLWLRCYNWDDVRATMALRNWMRDGMPLIQSSAHRTDCKICASLGLKSI